MTVAVLSALIAIATGVRPAFDAYGWLVWGRQALHLDLNTYSAPSWKPLPFLFTFPYALLGSAAVWPWMMTAVASALLGPVFAGRIAYRIAAPDSQYLYPRAVAALAAGAGVLGIKGYGHFVLIGYSDAMVVTLCLAAIDAHLSGHRRLAWTVLVLAAFGRPEVWLGTGGYALWLWRSEPSMRVWVGVGILAIPAAWFVIPALTSPSWLIAGDVAQSTAAAVKGSRLDAVLTRFTSLYELPIHIAALLTLAYAIYRRERTWLILAGLGLAWIAIEIAFVYHGWPASARYMFEAAAIEVVLVGAGVGRLLAVTAPFRLVRWAGVAAVAALFIVMAPHAQVRARLFHNGIVLGRNWAKMIHRLHGVVERDGGPARILACGQAVTTVSFQPILAWETNQNIANVGWNPEHWIEEGKPMVLFEPHRAGWIVTPIAIPASKRSRCESLAGKTPFQ